MESWLRLGLAPSRLRNLQGLFSIVGLACFYPALAVGFASGASPDYFLYSWARSLPGWADLLPTSAAASALAARVLSPPEMARFQAASPDMRRKHFLFLWTLKEAFMKGTGLGASLPLHDFDVSPAGPGLLRLKDAPAEPGRWRFDEFVPKPGVRAALAARTDDRDLVVQWRWADFE